MADNSIVSKLASSNPLTPYDVLGYLAPGGTFLVNVFLFEFWARRLLGYQAVVHTPLYSAISGVIRAAASGQHSWVLATFLLLVAIGAAYIAGHVVASFSAVMLDRVFVAKGHGYPSQKLLGIASTQTDYSRSFYRGLFFWINVVAVMFLLMVTVGREWTDGTQLAVWGIFLLVLLVMAVTAVLKMVLPKRDEYLALGYIVKSWSIAYDAVANLLANFLHTNKAFEAAFIAKFDAAFQRTFGLDYRTAVTENYWLPFIHVEIMAPSLTARIDNWLRLYGFARNLSTAFYLSFAYCILWLGWQGGLVADWASYEGHLLVALPGIFFITSVLLFVRYYYLYVNYYTKFILRSFVYVCEAGPSETLKV